MFFAKGSREDLGVAVRRGNELLLLIGPLSSLARLRSAREAVPGAREVSGGSKVSQEACEILLFPDAARGIWLATTRSSIRETESK